MLNELKKLAGSFKEIPYQRVQRNKKSYQLTLDVVSSELERLLSLYESFHDQDLQALRLIRDGIDFWLRRYHSYVIQGSIGSHYQEIGVDMNNCIFEHVIPAAKVRDMLLKKILTVKQALNAPTCVISKANDRILQLKGRVSSSPNYYHFFERYNIFGDTKFKTHSGTEINEPHLWTLDDHFFEVCNFD